MKQANTKLIQGFLLFVCCICFIVGATLSVYAEQDRATDVTKLKVEILSKENISSGSFKHRFGFSFKVTNLSKYPLDSASAEIEIYTASGELLMSGNINFNPSNDIQKNESKTFDVTFDVSTDDRAVNL